MPKYKTLLFLLMNALVFSVKANMTCELLLANHEESAVSNNKLGPESHRNEVAEFFTAFEYSDSIARGSVSHGVLAQTSWLTGMSFEELDAQLSAVGDISDISNDPAAKTIVLQTALISGSNVEEVKNYMRSFPDTNIKRGNLASLILIQTAFLSDSDPHLVIEYFNSFPKTIYRAREIGFGIIIQTAFLSSLEPKQEINVYYRKILPSLFAVANKGFISIFRQTSLFSERALLN